MSLENVERFEKLLREDKGIQAQLASASEAYAGERADEALFENCVAPIAESVGLPFTLDEALSYSSRSLSDAELEAVDGCSSFCYIIGGSDEPDPDDPMSGGACTSIGATWG